MAFDNFKTEIDLFGGNGPLYIDDREKIMHLFSEEKNRGPVLYLMFGITYQCQCHCRHCCTGTYKKEMEKDLTGEEIKDILDQIDQALVVNFFAGEPAMRPDIMELIQYASKKAIFVFMDSNGLKISKEFAQQLKECGLHLLYVSIDSPNPKEHDQFRGLKGCFDSAIGAIKNALSVGLKCVISTYITSENLSNGDFEKVIQMGRDLGAIGVRYLLPTPAGRWLYNTEVILTPEEEEKVRKITDFPFVCRDFYFQNQSSSQCRGMADKAYMYIGPTGTVQPCCFIQLSFGNVREEPFKNILNRMWSHSMFSEDYIYKECPMLSAEFREKYINTIPKDAELPFKMK
ncbi:MAG: radical SAM/SPASM domain-containing protein [Promethearchaeota archaeon]